MVSSSFLPGRGGIESYLAELCAELKPRLAVMAPAKREGRPIPTDLGYPTRGYAGSMLLPTRGVASAVVDEARRLGTERVLFGTPWPLVLIGPRLRAAGLRYAVIVHGAEILVPSAIPLVRRRLARALAGADLLLPVSEYTAERTRSFLTKAGFPVPRKEILRARVDVDRFHPGAAGADTRARFGLDPDVALLLCFGRLVKRKGVERAISALPSILREAGSVHLAVAGTGPEIKRLRRLAQRMQAPVTFLGRVADEDAPALHATADIFLLPVVDRYRGLEIEGLGVVLLEAGACETPSVTGRSGGTAEAVIDGKTGFVIDARSEQQLVLAVTRLVRDEELRRVMGRAARKHVKEEFTRERLPDALLEWLGNVG